MKPWRESAAVFILARDTENKNGKYDYKILTFIRTEKTSFFGKNVSLPGGAIDYEMDCTQDWNAFFEKHDFSFKTIENESRLKKHLIYQKRNNNEVSREISLRLTAIRETLEEVGIIFYKTPENIQSNFTSCFHSKSCDIPSWQKEIHQKNASLKSFFEKFNILPDMFKLFKWNVWLTPTSHSNKRYETAYFIAAIDSIPIVYPESYEVQNFSWNSPDELLDMHHKKLIWLPPPIFYELHRFLNQTKIDSIINFAAKGRSGQVPLIFPLAYQLKSSMVLIYPGDDLYPENPNLYETIHDVQKFSDVTFEELKKGCLNLCRIEIQDMYAQNFLCNISDELLPATSYLNNKL